MFLRCGTRMSFKAVRKPHIKKSVVAIAIAPLSVEAGVAVTIGDCGVAIAMRFKARGKKNYNFKCRRTQLIA
jgi:hypothetical protein